LSVEGKEKLLRAIEEDRESRCALMGLLSFRKVLDRITCLEERMVLVIEDLKRLGRRFEIYVDVS